MTDLAKIVALSLTGSIRDIATSAGIASLRGITRHLTHCTMPHTTILDSSKAREDESALNTVENTVFSGFASL